MCPPTRSAAGATEEQDFRPLRKRHLDTAGWPTCLADLVSNPPPASISATNSGRTSAIPPPPVPLDSELSRARATEISVKALSPPRRRSKDLAQSLVDGDGLLEDGPSAARGRLWERCREMTEVKGDTSRVIIREFARELKPSEIDQVAGGDYPGEITLGADGCSTFTSATNGGPDGTWDELDS